MFAGIIKEIGIVESVTPKGAMCSISIKAKCISKDAKTGDSISVDGVCLTAVKNFKDILSFDVIKETLRDTTLRNTKILDKVNLEPSLELGDRIGGHLVSGHIDEVGRVMNIVRHGSGVMELAIGICQERSRLLVEKGSIAVNGISLTLKKIAKAFFTVDIIPHTFEATTMKTKRVRDEVNIEFDLMAKYILNNISRFKDGTIDENFLKNSGFI